MIKRAGGFSLVELMVALAVISMAIAASSNIFLRMFTNLKQQSKIAETNINGIIGLEMMRRDIEHAGFGLPWVIPAGAGYNENVGPSALYRDPAPTPPRAVVSGNSAGLVPGSDYLVIKALNIANNAVAQRWTRLRQGNDKIDALSGDPFDLTDNVIVVNPGTNSGNARTLVLGGGGFWTAYNGTAGFAPTGVQTNLVYGVDPTNAPLMPYNRADYYISLGSATVNVPTQCAPATGVLVKGEISHQNGATVEMPLVDCVADMQAIYGLDTDDDGDIDARVDTLAGYDAQQTRDELKEVRVYILGHEGQRDPTFIYPNNTVTVGEFGQGRNFNLTGIANWQQYRWKVYTMVMRTESF